MLWLLSGFGEVDGFTTHMLAQGVTVSLGKEEKEVLDVPDGARNRSDVDNCDSFERGDLFPNVHASHVG